MLQIKTYLQKDNFYREILVIFKNYCINIDDVFEG